MTITTFIILISIFLINYLVYKKNLIPKKLFIISSIFMMIYIIIAILIYYNNIKSGYTTGILFGDVFNTHFCDEYKYNIDSEILLSHLRNGDFTAWINHQLPLYEYVDPSSHASYGNYNIYVIILTFLKLIGITSVLDLILLKILFYIPTVYFLYKLSNIYLNENYSLISVIIFSLLPGYILTNTLIMRDNIIILLIISLLYLILSKAKSLKSILLYILLTLCLLKFRSYSILVFIATIIFTFKNDKHIFTLKDLLYLVVIISTLYFMVNFNFELKHSNEFFSFFQIKALQDSFRTNFGTGLSMIIKVFYQLVIHIIYDPFYFNFLNSKLLYLILISLGNILGTLLSTLFAIDYIYSILKFKDRKIVHLLKFTTYFTLLTGLVVLSKDLFIINRVALMWLPLFIIIILYIIQHFRLLKK